MEVIELVAGLFVGWLRAVSGLAQGCLWTGSGLFLDWRRARYEPDDSFVKYSYYDRTG